MSYLTSKKKKKNARVLPSEQAEELQPINQEKHPAMWSD